MRRMWIGVFFLIFILAAGFLLLVVTRDFHEEFSEKMEQAAEDAMAGRWEDAEKKVAQGKDQWDSYRKFLASFTDHEPVEEVESLFSQLEIYEKKRYEAEFAAICMELSHLSEAIEEGHSARWWSIL